jgi:UDP-2,3-diacylglucosamine pyrophosphatase LpxH
MKTDKKVALITDSHFGIRKGSQIFHDYFAEFYHGTFFQYLDRHNIDTVVHLGDCFDVRKGIDYWSLDWAKTNFFNPLRDRGIDLHLIVGNHDIFYKETLSINSAVLNLAEYDNIAIYAGPQTVTIKGTDVFMVPWICTGNAERFAQELDASSASVSMGHLELAGFYANKDYQCQHGTDAKIFSKFDRVFSGHFHKKSTSGNITYLGIILLFCIHIIKNYYLFVNRLTNHHFVSRMYMTLTNQHYSYYSPSGTSGESSKILSNRLRVSSVLPTYPTFSFD